ncbi:MAG: TonB family protein [Limisphaerales bacterium]
MNRLQKKCIIATAGFHLLLLVILFVGPAFFWEREKLDDFQVIEMISPNLVDSATTGIQNAQPPPPTPVAVPPPQPTPTPPAPVPTPVKPEVAPDPVPVPMPKPEKVEPVKPPKEKIKPDLTPVEKPVEKPSVTKPPTPKVNLTLTTRPITKTTTTTAKPSPVHDNSKAVNSALRALRENLSTPTTIAPVGNSSAAAANYGATVKAVYEQAWILPDDMASDQANTKIRVTIASDGTVISARIINRSGDAKLDDSVQRTLDRVQFIAPFPSGSTDKERSYIINFNPQIKRMNG